MFQFVQSYESRYAGRIHVLIGSSITNRRGDYLYDDVSARTPSRPEAPLVGTQSSGVDSEFSFGLCNCLRPLIPFRMVVMTVIVVRDVVVLVIMVVIVVLTMVVGMNTALLPRPLHLRIEHTFDRWIFLVFFDLFDLEGNAQPFRKVAFCDRQIACYSAAGIEVLMKPEEWRGNDRTRLPIHFYRFVVFQIVLACQRESFAVQSQDDGLIRVPMAELV